MKTCKHFMDSFTDWGNLERAYKRMNKNKKYAEERYLFDINHEENMAIIQELLKNGTYTFDEAWQRVIYDPQKRTLAIPEYIDRLVEGAFDIAAAPLINSYMINGSFSCIKNKGMIKAIERIQSYLREPGTRVILSSDVKSCFDSFHHPVILYAWSRIISDIDALAFLDSNLQMMGSDGRGVDKGNVLSQDHGNLVMGLLDHYVCDELGFGKRVRYMDDSRDFLRSREEAKDLLEEEEIFCKRLGISLHPEKTKIFDYDDSKGIDFCKRIIHRNYVDLAPRRIYQTIRKVKRHAREIEAGRIPLKQLSHDFDSFAGELKHVRQTELTDKCQNIILNEMKRLNG